MPAPTPPSDVAGGSPATSAWANSVSDAVQQLIADLYPAGELALGWAAITGKPATFPASAHTHAAGSVEGQVPYGNITGKPADAAALGGWLRSGGGSKIWAQNGAPGSPSEGDVWIKG
jgi:hypothetical protein